MSIKKLGLAVAIAGLAACGGESGTSDIEAPYTLENAQKVIETNADIAAAVYSDSVDTATELQAKVDDFVALAADATANQADVQNTFVAAKRAWLVAREPYGQSEVYRFREGPIDNEEDGPEGLINAWPLGEALIDAVITGANTDFPGDGSIVGVTTNAIGINNNGEVIGNETGENRNIIFSNLEINDALFDNGTQADDERDVISGYHAIEFILWGQDIKPDTFAERLTVDSEESRAEAVQTSENGGSRQVSDFTGTSNEAVRRREFLKAVTARLVSDLTTVRDAWISADGVKGEHYNEFVTVNSLREAQAKLEKILFAMGTLSQGELAGERMQIAFAGQSQEDEHSCFSDNTHRDIALNAEGIAMQYQFEARENAHSTPDSIHSLAAIYQPNVDLQVLPAPAQLWSKCQGYIGSTAVCSESSVAAFTSPRGDIAAFWDIENGSLLDIYRLNDVCGVSVNHDQHYFVLTNSHGSVRYLNTHTMKENRNRRQKFTAHQWDNHLLMIPNSHRVSAHT